jgi:hypothetical protein
MTNSSGFEETIPRNDHITAGAIARHRGGEADLAPPGAMYAALEQEDLGRGLARAFDGPRRTVQIAGAGRCRQRVGAGCIICYIGAGWPSERN